MSVSPAPSTRMPARAPARDDRSYIRTYTGGKFWPLAPSVEEISLEDIAHALSQLCRFTGHSRQFYSVAQHSVIVAEHVARSGAPGLWGLLHDASEAYLNDLARPVKHAPALASYRAAEARLQAMVFSKFGLAGPVPASVKVMDLWVLHAELRDLVRGADPRHVDAAGDHPVIAPVPPVQAKQLFLETFERYALAGGR